MLPPSPPWLPEPEKSFWPSPSAHERWGDGQFSVLDQEAQEQLRVGRKGVNVQALPPPEAWKSVPGLFEL